MLGHVFNRWLTTLCFYFLISRSPVGSQSWELRAFSSFSWTCAGPYPCAHLIIFPEYYWSFQKSLWKSHSPAFHLKRLINSLLASLFQTALKRNNTHLQREDFSHWGSFSLGQIKTYLQVESSRKSSDKNYWFSEDEALKEPQPFSSSSAVS